MASIDVICLSCSAVDGVFRNGKIPQIISAIAVFPHIASCWVSNDKHRSATSLLPFPLHQ
ncbi:hypothetical protein PCO82_14960 [Pectobacteriaceae bacterium CE90]|nr:hypothetical protein PCO82_14960 [Pectobacteriaceae bacterium CE90]